MLQTGLTFADTSLVLCQAHLDYKLNKLDLHMGKAIAELVNLCELTSCLDRYTEFASGKNQENFSESQKTFQLPMVGCRSRKENHKTDRNCKVREMLEKV